MSRKLEDYDVLGVIGSGSFGTCYKVFCKNTKMIFVWKAIDYGKFSEAKRENLVSEVNLLSQLNHPNIVKYYDRIVHLETTTLYIITEWCQGGDLSDLIKNVRRSGKRIHEDFAWKVLYQISKAVQVCHSKLEGFTVLHRDIKPANVFLDEHGNAKLGDFGLARVEQKDGEVPEIVGTPYYLSPEVVRGQRHNRKSDIWSLGCLVYELCTLAPPFTGSSIKELTQNIKYGNYKPISSFYSDNLQKIISFMLSVKHEYRPTVEIILHHPLVVVNIKSAPKKKDVTDIIKGINDISITTDAEEVTENKFREKWKSRLENLMVKEAKIKEREEMVAAKEKSLINKERQLALDKQKMSIKRRKNPRVLSLIDDNVSDVSADPGDTSIMPTTAKMNPNLLRPNFSSSLSDKKMLNKHVHFVLGQRRALSENTVRPESSNSHSSGVSLLDQQSAWIDKKKYERNDSIKVKVEKKDKFFKLVNFR